MDLGQVSMTLVLLVLLALAFDFMNGFHDAANSIATVVSTGVLKPWQAVLWAAFFNVLAWAFFELAVAATVGKGIIDPAFVDSRVIFGALIGAISWNLITWYYGIPSSSSHALIGGLIGAALIKAGAAPLLWPGILKTASFIFIAPLLGMALGALIMLIVSWIFFRQTPRRVDRWFRRLQLVSSAAYSMGHGGNDAQKTMGIIWLLLIANGVTTEDRLPLGRDELLRRDRHRHDVRRLAHRQDHGSAHHEAEAGRRICRRNRRLDHLVHGHPLRHPRFHHAHHHGRDHRRRHHEGLVGRALGRRGQHRDRVDHHDPGVRGHRRAGMVDRRLVLLAT